LILTESIIDAASLLEVKEIRTKYKVLALYGTNGLTTEHQQAIKELAELEEVILFLNGDDAGKKAVEKYGSMLKSEYPQIKISKVENSLLQGHSPEILIHLLKSRKEYDFLFSNEKSIENKKEETTEIEPEVEVKKGLKERMKNGLDTNNPYNLKYSGKEAKYQIKGFKINQMDSLKITLQIQSL